MGAMPFRRRAPIKPPFSLAACQKRLHSRRTRAARQAGDHSAPRTPSLALRGAWAIHGPLLRIPRPSDDATRFKHCRFGGACSRRDSLLGYNERLTFRFRTPRHVLRLRH